MSEPIGDDPLERLRRANPVDPEGLPAASLARVRARFQEESMIHADTRSRPASGRARLAFATFGSAVLAVAIAAFIAPRTEAPGSVPSPSGRPISAACVETYSLDSLGRRSFAFDGAVSAIDGDEVTFDVNEAFRGVGSDPITLITTGMTGSVVSSVGGPTLMPGGRYLVAGDDRFAWACGFTQYFDPTVAATWRATLSS